MSLVRLLDIGPTYKNQCYLLKRTAYNKVDVKCNSIYSSFKNMKSCIKDMQDLHTENYETLLKKVNKDLNQEL